MTRFPIFRSLQRAIGGGVVKRHDPSVAVAATRVQLNEAKVEGEEADDRSEELVLPEVVHVQGGGSQFDNPSAWPINSERARQLRREFLLEGYRKLFTIASGQTLVPGVIRAAEQEVANNERERDRFAAELIRAVAVENGRHSQNERPVMARDNDVSGGAGGDWMYYAQ